MFLDSELTVFTFLSWLDLLCVALWISIQKYFKLLLNYWQRVTDITSFEEHLESSQGHNLNLYLNMVKYRFKNMFQKDSLHKYFTVV